MKRCAQCDFIYEDDQNFCDVDGGELFYDLRGLSPPEDAATRLAGQHLKSPWRSHPVLLLAGVVFAAALFLTYYVLTHQAATPHTDQPLAKVVAGPQPAPDLVSAAPAATATPSTAPSPVTDVNAPKGVSPIVRRSPSPAPRRVEKKRKPERASSKSESKLGSALKKAGRVLKKPFKF